MTDSGWVEVACTDCGFRRVLSVDDDELPAAVVVRHGRENGHQLAITRLEAGAEPPAAD